MCFCLCLCLCIHHIFYAADRRIWLDCFLHLLHENPVSIRNMNVPDEVQLHSNWVCVIAVICHSKCSLVFTCAAHVWNWFRMRSTLFACVKCNWCLFGGKPTDTIQMANGYKCNICPLTNIDAIDQMCSIRWKSVIKRRMVIMWTLECLATFNFRVHDRISI